MVRVLSSLLCSIVFMTLVVGCGGSEEVGGTNLNSDEAKNKAAQAAAEYAGAGRKGPAAPAAPGTPATPGTAAAPATEAAPAQK